MCVSLWTVRRFSYSVPILSQGNLKEEIAQMQQMEDKVNVRLVELTEKKEASQVRNWVNCAFKRNSADLTRLLGILWLHKNVILSHLDFSNIQ